jgi:hypothetical protein
MRKPTQVAVLALTSAASALACLTSCEPAGWPGSHIEKTCSRQAPLHIPSAEANAVPFKLVLRDKTSRLFGMKSVCVLLDDRALVPPGKVGAVDAALNGGHSVALDTKLMPTTSHLVEVRFTLEGTGTLADYKFVVTSRHIVGSANGITLEVDLYEADVPQPERRPKVAYRETPQSDGGLSMPPVSPDKQ